MEKVGHFVDDEQDHTDPQGTDGHDTNNGQASLRTVEDSQHGGDHTDNQVPMAVKTERTESTTPVAVPVNIMGLKNTETQPFKKFYYARSGHNRST